MLYLMVPRWSASWANAGGRWGYSHYSRRRVYLDRSTLRYQGDHLQGKTTVNSSDGTTNDLTVITRNFTNLLAIITANTSAEKTIASPALPFAIFRF